MAASTFMPDVVVEIAFNAGYTTPAASRTWTDVSTYVEAQDKIKIGRGRPDQFGNVPPSTLALTLDNRDGRFTPENAAGAHYPNVKKGRPIRVRATWPLGGGGTTHHRFLGYIDEWPVEWPDGTSSQNKVQIKATSRGARVNRTVELRSIIEEEYGQDSPVLHFPLGEAAGSTDAGNVVAGRSDRLSIVTVGGSGALTFAGATGPTTDEIPAPLFAPTGASNGKYLKSMLLAPVTQVGDHVVAVEAFFTTTGLVGSETTETLVALIAGNTLNSLPWPAVWLEMNSSNRIVARVSPGGGAAASSTSSGSSYNDGLLHHAVALMEISDAGTAKVKLILDGVDEGYSSNVTWPFVVGGVAYFPQFAQLFVGGTEGGVSTTSLDLWQGSIAHAAVYRAASAPMDVARFTAHWDAGATGFAGEGSGVRIARYARYAGIPAAEISTETGLTTSVAHKNTEGELPLQLMEAIALTEDGLLFDGKDGTLTFHARSHRYGATSAFTLSVVAGDVEQALLPRLDDQGLTNDMTVTRPGGGTPARSKNQASIDEHGYYRQSVELLTTSDNEAQSRADWQVNRFGTPRVTVPNVKVDLISCASSLVTSLLSADLGTRFTLSGLHSQAPSSSMDFFIEGITEEFGAETWTMEFNTSAAAYANVWQLDSATLSQLDQTTVLAY